MNRQNWHTKEVSEADEAAMKKERQKRINAEWTLVEDKLPVTWNKAQGFGLYLATVLYSDGSIAVRVCEYNTVSGWWYEMNKGVKVIAWRELPEPFQPIED